MVAGMTFALSCEATRRLGSYERCDNHEYQEEKGELDRV